MDAALPCGLPVTSHITTGKTCRALHSLGMSLLDHRCFSDPLPSYRTSVLHTIPDHKVSHVWLSLTSFWFEAEIARASWLFALGLFCFLFLIVSWGQDMLSLMAMECSLFQTHICSSLYLLFVGFPAFSHLQNLHSELSLCVSMLPSEPGLCCLSVAACGVSSIR